MLHITIESARPSAGTVLTAMLLLFSMKFLGYEWNFLGYKGNFESPFPADTSRYNDSRYYIKMMSFWHNYIKMTSLLHQNNVILM